MTSEHQHMDKSKFSSASIDSAGQMRGWFKLIETIRKTDPPSNETIRTNNGSTVITDTDDHISKSPPTVYSESPPPESPEPVISPPTPPNPSPSTSKSTGTKRSSIRHKKITIRKSTRSKDLSSATTTDDTLPNRKRLSVDSSVVSSIAPLATNLHSLPGLDQDELRDQRFLDYSDINTLSMHLHTCLYIDKRFFLSSLTKQHIFKTRHNVLNKIFRLYHLKTSAKSSWEKKEEPVKADLSATIISPSFKTDWSVNRRSSSSHRHEPKNPFHILQLNPQNRLSVTTKKRLIEELSDDEQQNLHYEHIKSLLVRTYHPHFHTAVQRGHYFGSKSKIFRKQSTLPIVINPPSPPDMDETVAIKLHSPVFMREEDAKKSGRRSRHKRNREEPLPLTCVERRVSEEIPAVVILTSPPSRSVEKEVNNNTILNRKRRTSITLHSSVNERKKRKITAPLSPELVSNESHNLSNSDSDDDVLPNGLPKPNFIKNGLRSNFYKTVGDIESKPTNSKLRPSRRPRQPTSALPPFYTGLFQSDDQNLTHIDYQLPYDIYWFSQQRGNAVPSPAKPPTQQNKKKSSESKQKQTLPNKRIVRNTSFDLSVQQHTPHTTKRHSNRDSIKMEELTAEEKQIISQCAIFLKRNLRRIKEQRECKDKNNNQQKQHTNEPSLPLFFPQNYYHPDGTSRTNGSEDYSNLSHKDLLNLSSNLLRRSHFGKSGQYYLELIDTAYYYAQLAQLTLVLNDIFDLLLNYKCRNGDVHPSNALKKCPLKRLFPMYYEIISKPMDLSMIRHKLDNGDYLAYSAFEQDFVLLFTNAINYCGEDSDVGRAVQELRGYFTNILKPHFEFTIDLFNDLQQDDEVGRDLKTFEEFITRFHAKEGLDGQIRETVYNIIFDVDSTSPIVYKTVAPATTNTHRASKNTFASDCIVHCRCGSVHDETLLVQCYACQLWQHASCTAIIDTTRPYFCFECHPMCQEDPSHCLQTNVCIAEANQASSYSTITRSDGLIVRINECYLIVKQAAHSSLPSATPYDIFSVERLWLDEKNVARASGFYYLRPSETFHEVNRKFFSNEVFRFPSMNDSVELTSIIRPCYVLDTSTFCKGKPVCEYGSRIPSTDLYICEYRVDKLARAFTRLPKSKHVAMNTRSYCFDNYIEKLTIKRDYQSHQKEFYREQQTSRRRSITHPSKLTGKQLDEKSSHIDGIVEKIYCRFHHADLIPTETKLSSDQFFQRPTINEQSTGCGSKRLRNKNRTSSSIISKKRLTQSLSSNDNPSEAAASDAVVSALLDELIQSISSHVS